MSDDTQNEPGEQDAAFLDVDEADVETSPDEGPHAAGLARGDDADVGPGTDDEDTTVSQLTDALDSDALAAGEAPQSDTSR